MSNRKTIEVILDAEESVWCRVEVTPEELAGVQKVVEALTANRRDGGYAPYIELKVLED